MWPLATNWILVKGILKIFLLAFQKCCVTCRYESWNCRKLFPTYWHQEKPLAYWHILLHWHIGTYYCVNKSEQTNTFFLTSHRLFQSLRAQSFGVAFTSTIGEKNKNTIPLVQKLHQIHLCSKTPNSKYSLCSHQMFGSCPGLVSPATGCAGGAGQDLWSGFTQDTSPPWFRSTQ